MSGIFRGQVAIRLQELIKRSVTQTIQGSPYSGGTNVELSGGYGYDDLQTPFACSGDGWVDGYGYDLWFWIPAPNGIVLGYGPSRLSGGGYIAAYDNTNQPCTLFGPHGSVYSYVYDGNKGFASACLFLAFIDDYWLPMRLSDAGGEASNASIPKSGAVTLYCVFSWFYHENDGLIGTIESYWNDQCCANDLHVSTRKRLSVSRR